MCNSGFLLHKYIRSQLTLHWCPDTFQCSRRTLNSPPAEGDLYCDIFLSTHSKETLLNPLVNFNAFFLQTSYIGLSKYVYFPQTLKMENLNWPTVHFALITSRSHHKAAFLKLLPEVRRIPAKLYVKGTVHT